MGFMRLFKGYVRPSPVGSADGEADFVEVARSVDRADLAAAIGAALRSSQTPFADIVGQLFGRSSPHQQAALLNEFLKLISPAALSAIGGGYLGHLVGRDAGSASSAQALTAAQASQVSPAAVRDIAANAEKRDPDVIDRVAELCADHPELVRDMGASFMASVLAELNGP